MRSVSHSGRWLVHCCCIGVASHIYGGYGGARMELASKEHARHSQERLFTY